MPTLFHVKGPFNTSIGIVETVRYKRLIKKPSPLATAIKLTLEAPDGCPAIILANPEPAGNLGYTFLHVAYLNHVLQVGQTPGQIVDSIREALNLQQRINVGVVYLANNMLPGNSAIFCRPALHFLYQQQGYPSGQLTQSLIEVAFGITFVKKPLVPNLDFE